MKFFRYLAVSAVGLLATQGQALAIDVVSVSVETLSSSAVQVSWEASEEAAFYDVYQDGRRIQSGVTATSYDVTGLEAETTYRYFVTACEASGVCSGPPGQVTAVTFATGFEPGVCMLGADGPVPVLYLAKGDDDTATLSWCEVPDAEGYNLFLNYGYATTFDANTLSTVVTYTGSERYTIAWYEQGNYPSMSALAIEVDSSTSPPMENNQDALARLDAASNDNSNDVEIYFTRHAEKMTQLAEQEDGSFIEVCGESKCAEVLNAKGELRADLLAELFSTAGITQRLTHAFSSHKIRTRQTIEQIVAEAGLSGDMDKFPNDGIQEFPISNDDGSADATELDPESTSPSKAPVIEALLSLPAGSVALVAGHSGTLYDIMAGIGLTDVCLTATVDTCDTNRYPIDEDVKVRNFGDIWKMTLQDGVADFVYRVNLQPRDLNIDELAR